MYACVGMLMNIVGFFPFFVPVGPLGLIIVRHFQKKFSNAAMLRSGKNTANDTII